MESMALRSNRSDAEVRMALSVTAPTAATAEMSPESLADYSQQPLTPSSLAASPPKHTRPTANPNSTAHKPSRDHCDRRNPDEGSVSRLPNIPQHAVGQTMTPFLREHIPGLYAPIGKPDIPAIMNAKSEHPEQDPSSRYCYRHMPDSKCRKAADETKMALIQSELERLPSADQQAITHVWSLFSAAPGRHRQLMLQGIITQCCFPQLSMVSREVSEQLKIDFLTALPAELSFMILRHLDCVSLCKAAQVSRRWKTLADDDNVWHRMCEQHIDRKCTACGWGLPRLERGHLREWKRQQQLLREQRDSGRVVELGGTSSAPGPEPVEGPAPTSPAKRIAPAPAVDDEHRAKRQRTQGDRNDSVERRFRPWKTVYKERFRVGSNWKYGRCSMKIFRNEHTNGVTCLQFDDNILATGSYDSTIKLWDIDVRLQLRHGFWRASTAYAVLWSNY